jgi:hypothetical protein
MPRKFAAPGNAGVDSIIETGRLVQQAKTELKHVEFLDMVKDDLPFDRTTAFRLMAIAENPVIANVAHVHHLPPSWGTLYELTKLPAEMLEARIIDGTVNAKMQRNQAVALRRPPAPAEPGDDDDDPAPPPYTPGPHFYCIQLDALAESWDDHRTAGAIQSVLMAARRAPDAPKHGIGDPAEASSRTIMQLGRWIPLLREGTKTARRPQRRRHHCVQLREELVVALRRVR